MEKNKSKILQTQNFEEFELVNKDGEKQYAALAEKNVTAKEIETIDTNGKKIVRWRLYSNGVRIATVYPSGKIILSDEYKELLKNEKSIGADGKEIVAERWILAMVPVNARFTTNAIEKLPERELIKKIDMKERIKQEKQKEKDDKTNSLKKTDSENKVQENREIKTQEIEKMLKLPDGDIQTCTVIKDKRFYENVPEAKKAQGLSYLAYSKSQNSFIMVNIDEKGNINILDSVQPSIQKGGVTTETYQNKLKEEAIGNVMNVKGKPDLQYSARIRPGTGEIEISELRVDLTDNNHDRYISSKLYTLTQKPTKEEIDALNVKNNPEISDEKETLEEYRKAGIQVTTIYALTESERIKNEILTISEVKEIVSDKLTDKQKEKEQIIQEKVIKALQGKKAHEITKELVDEVFKEQIEKEIDEGRTPGSDAEARRLSGM